MTTVAKQKISQNLKSELENEHFTGSHFTSRIYINTDSNKILQEVENMPSIIGIKRR